MGSDFGRYFGSCFLVNEKRPKEFCRRTCSDFHIALTRHVIQYQCVSFILPKNVDILSFLEELMFWVLSSRVVGESSGYFGSCFLMSTKKKAQRIL